MDPLVISWGYDAEPGFGSGNQFIDYHEWQGTRDIAAFLTVPAAIDFQREQDWGQVRARCRNLLGIAREKYYALGGIPPASPNPDEWLGQMDILPLPKGIDALDLKTRLYDEYKIEIPKTAYKDQSFLRLSIQGYNTMQDVSSLLSALEALLLDMCKE